MHALVGEEVEGSEAVSATQEREQAERSTIITVGTRYGRTLIRSKGRVEMGLTKATEQP